MEGETSVCFVQMDDIIVVQQFYSVNLKELSEEDVKKSLDKFSRLLRS